MARAGNSRVKLGRFFWRKFLRKFLDFRALRSDLCSFSLIHSLYSLILSLYIFSWFDFLTF